MTIICGSDFSAPAARAARVAALIAAKVKEPLRLIHVVDAFAAGLGARSSPNDPEHARLRVDANGLRALGAEVQEEVLTGHPDEVLASVALQSNARMVIIAAVGTRDPRRWLLGSTAGRTVQGSPVPVLVVRDSAAFEAWLSGERRLRLMIGVDFSASADAGIRWMRQLRDIGPCDVIIEHIAWMPGERDRLGMHSETDLARLRPEIERILLRDLQAKVGVVPGEGEVSLHVDFWDSGVDQRLIMLATEAQVDVLAVGVRRHAVGPDSFWHCMTSRGVVHQAPMTVACIPVPSREDILKPIPSIRQVLVPSDLSELGNRAAAFAYALVVAGGTVHLVHVAASPDTDHTLRARLQSLIPSEAKSRGIGTQVHILEGRDAATELCAAAERLGVDVICLGSHGASGLAARLLGSVTQKVLAESRRPVLVIRPPPG